MGDAFQVRFKSQVISANPNETGPVPAQKNTFHEYQGIHPFATDIAQRINKNFWGLLFPENGKGGLILC